ncbi:MAG TPA: M1 family metallopeptidase [Bryobacteraceae bacterium]|nr:M1 family metallopeptidase [Bryobacteraceae bacterium]
MKRASGPALAALFLFFTLRVSAAPPPRPYDVDNYDVKIAPDLGAKRLEGEVTIRFHSIVDGLDSLELDAGALDVREVLEDSAGLRFERRGELLIVQLSKPVHLGEEPEITVRYNAGPAAGLNFFEDQVYTAYFTSHWMVSNDRPEDRATLRLVITAPASAKVAASGRLIKTRREGSHSVSEWRQDAEVPPFVFGFAAGDFAENSAQANRVKLRYLATRSPQSKNDAAALKKIFQNTAPALRFLEEKSGMPYPGPTYTQILARGDPKQEAATFTLLPEEYGKTLLSKPDDLWLLVHELAHQWYGIGIACRDWSDFWLNEGLATFLADGFLEQQFGAERYQHEIDDARATYEKFKADGRDRPLSFHGWNVAREAGGSIPYYKGAWVLHLLRQQMGEDAFWRGLRVYTKDNWGRATTSRDFQKSMEAAAATNLAEFFNMWVYR